VKVVIFNSSSDEIASIPELKEYNFFGEQNDAIKKLLKLLYTSNEFEVVLRIHPNLGSVKYKYHLELYNLKNEFKELIIFEASHSINSYELVCYSDLVITFGSTIGVEATYLNKPVINLGAASYFEIDVTYNPRTMEELEKLIQNSRKLLPKPLENAFKYGYYKNHTIDYSKFVARVHKFLGIFSFYNYQRPILKFQFLKRMILLKDTFQPLTKSLSSIPMLEEE
jgi:capsule polysaccharide export protein KpsC/LpsZ